MGTPDVIEMPIDKYMLNFVKKVGNCSNSKKEVLLGGNDEHGDAHRFGNTSQNSNDVSLKLVACFDTNLGILQKLKKRVKQNGLYNVVE
jgi:hypothetical protein